MPRIPFPIFLIVPPKSPISSEKFPTFTAFFVRKEGYGERCLNFAKRTLQNLFHRLYKEVKCGLLPFFWSVVSDFTE